MMQWKDDPRFRDFQDAVWPTIQKGFLVELLPDEAWASRFPGGGILRHAIVKERFDYHLVVIELTQENTEAMLECRYIPKTKIARKEDICNVHPTRP